MKTEEHSDGKENSPRKAGLDESAARRAVEKSDLPDDVSREAKRAWTRYRACLDYFAGAEKNFKRLACCVSNADATFVIRTTYD